jgi:hypothetical protein
MCKDAFVSAAERPRCRFDDAGGVSAARSGTRLGLDNNVDGKSRLRGALGMHNGGIRVGKTEGHAGDGVVSHLIRGQKSTAGCGEHLGSVGDRLKLQNWVLEFPRWVSALVGVDCTATGHFVVA